MPVVRVILREGQEKLYHEAQASIHTPGSHLTDYPESRQHRGISIGVLPVLGICRGARGGHGRGHPDRYVSEWVRGDLAGRERSSRGAVVRLLEIASDRVRSARSGLAWLTD